MGEQFAKVAQARELELIRHEPSTDSLRVMLLAKGLDRSTCSAVRAAANTCQASYASTPNRSVLLQNLRSGNVDVVLIRADQPWSRELTELMRLAGGTAPIMIGLVARASDMLLREFISWGGDEITTVASSRDVGSRLHTIQKDFNDENRRGSGTHPIAQPRARQFVFLRLGTPQDYSRERFLERLGHVAFSTTDPEEAIKRLDHGSHVDLIVEVGADELQETEITQQALSHPHCANIVLLVAPTQLQSPRPAWENRRIAVVDAHGTGDEILYSIHQLESGNLERRAVPRILYGTEVTIREMAAAHVDLGFTHNVSIGGLYIRTLAQPRAENVVLELIPPRSTERVHLVGRVAWRTPISRLRSGGAPPGFGVQIIDGARHCLDEWKKGCMLLSQYCCGQGGRATATYCAAEPSA